MMRAKGSLVLLSVMVAACDAGPKEVEVTQRVAALTADSSSNAMGFENASDWSSTTPGVVIGLSRTHTEGASSLAVTPAPNQNWNPINSVPLSTLAVSPTLAIDVMLPTQQPNPYWFGAVQLYITCPSHNVYNDYLADVELTGLPVGVWNTLTFPLPLSNPSPNGLLANLLASGYSDLFFTVVLNVPMPAGTYLLDNLRFVPVDATGCSGQPNGTLCNDGNACTSGETCNAGTCVPASTVTCAATDQCHQAGQCDPQTGACGAGQPVTDWTPCSSGDLCTHGQSCHAGVCGGGQTTCDDGNPCTADSCAAGTGTCTHTPIAGDACDSALAAAAFTSLQGRVAFTTESDNNRCVPDPGHILNRLNAQGELMGWHYAHAGYAPLDSDHFHTETIVRMPYVGAPASELDGSVFMSAFSHPPCTDQQSMSAGECGPQMGVAQLAFKTGRSGYLLGTNREYNGAPDQTASDWEVTPNPSDTFLPIGSPATPRFNMLPSNPPENHPGGASALGTHVVVGIQQFDENCSQDGELIGLIGIEGGGCDPIPSRGIAQVWDLTTPLLPVLRASYETFTDFDAVKAAGSGETAVATGLAKLNDGRFLLAVNKDSPTPQIEFYVSVDANIDDQDLFGDPGRAPDAVVSVGSPGSLRDLSAHPPDWQSFSFLTGCDGSLWIIGMRGDDSGFPDGDAVDLYEVSIAPASASTCGTASQYCVQMTNAADVPTVVDSDFQVLDSEGMKHMFCPDNSGTDQCDMKSGAGAYVDPNGQVIIYATDFDGDGGQTSFVTGNSPASNLYSSFAGYIRGKEFHQRHGNLAPGTACPTINTAWVEFYSNPNYDDFGDDTGQIFYQDYQSRLQRNPYFGTNDFAGKAHSVRWCLPPGTAYEVFQGNQTGSHGFLNGTGQVAEIADLGSPALTFPYGGGNVNGNSFSGIFVTTGSDSLGWTGTPDQTQ